MDQSFTGILNFVRAAELGSFSGAGKELGISPVAVSKNISRLEKSLGVRLFARSTRALALTPEGNAFLDQCRSPLTQLREACQQVAGDAQSPRGLVRVTLVSPVADLFLMPHLHRFAAQYPDIQLHLELDDSITPMIASKFDVGIRAGRLNDEAFVARPLGPLRLLLCASPAYLQQHGAPARLEDLESHAGLMLQMTSQEQPSPWMFWVADGVNGGAQSGVRTFKPRRQLLCNDYRSLLTATLDGLGLAHLPQPLVMDALRKGTLVQLLPQYTLEGLQLFVHYPSRKQLPARVRAFVDFVVEGLGGHEDLVTEPTSLKRSPAAKPAITKTKVSTGGQQRPASARTKPARR
jgi:DNA-binding transcriptional LysR family regulator